MAKYQIPAGNHCMEADGSEAIADSRCLFLDRVPGGSGAIGCHGTEDDACSGVIICPMRTYRCKRYPEYELGVHKTRSRTTVLKCPECLFDSEMEVLEGMVRTDD